MPFSQYFPSLSKSKVANSGDRSKQEQVTAETLYLLRENLT